MPNNQEFDISSGLENAAVKLIGNALTLPEPKPVSLGTLSPQALKAALEERGKALWQIRNLQDRYESLGSITQNIKPTEADKTIPEQIQALGEKVSKSDATLQQYGVSPELLAGHNHIIDTKYKDALDEIAQYKLEKAKQDIFANVGNVSEKPIPEQLGLMIQKPLQETYANLTSGTLGGLVEGTMGNPLIRNLLRTMLLPVHSLLSGQGVDYSKLGNVAIGAMRPEETLTGPQPNPISNILSGNIQPFMNTATGSPTPFLGLQPTLGDVSNAIPAGQAVESAVTSVTPPLLRDISANVSRLPNMARIVDFGTKAKDFLARTSDEMNQGANMINMIADTGAYFGSPAGLTEAIASKAMAVGTTKLESRASELIKGTIDTGLAGDGVTGVIARSLPTISQIGQVDEIIPRGWPKDTGVSPDFVKAMSEQFSPIPALKSTNEAEVYGASIKGDRGQINELLFRHDAAIHEAKAINIGVDAPIEDMQRAIKLREEAQFYREAAQTAAGVKNEEELRKLFGPKKTVTYPLGAIDKALDRESKAMTAAFETQAKVQKSLNRSLSNLMDNMYKEPKSQGFPESILKPNIQRVSEEAKKIYLESKNALYKAKFPMRGFFRNEEVTILGPADNFEPYKTALKKGEKPDVTQLMFENKNGTRFITFASSLKDISNKRLLPTNKELTSISLRPSKEQENIYKIGIIDRRLADPNTPEQYRAPLFQIQDRLIKETFDYNGAEFEKKLKAVDEALQALPVKTLKSGVQRTLISENKLFAMRYTNELKNFMSSITGIPTYDKRMYDMFASLKEKTFGTALNELKNAVINPSKIRFSDKRASSLFGKPNDYVTAWFSRFWDNNPWFRKSVEAGHDMPKSLLYSFFYPRVPEVQKITDAGKFAERMKPKGEIDMMSDMIKNMPKTIIGDEKRELRIKIYQALNKYVTPAQIPADELKALGADGVNAFRWFREVGWPRGADLINSINPIKLRPQDRIPNYALRLIPKEDVIYAQELEMKELGDAIRDGVDVQQNQVRLNKMTRDYYKLKSNINMSPTEIKVIPKYTYAPMLKQRTLRDAAFDRIDIFDAYQKYVQLTMRYLYDRPVLQYSQNVMLQMKDKFYADWVRDYLKRYSGVTKDNKVAQFLTALSYLSSMGGNTANAFQNAMQPINSFVHESPEWATKGVWGIATQDPLTYWYLANSGHNDDFKIMTDFINGQRGVMDTLVGKGMYLHGKVEIVNRRHSGVTSFLANYAQPERPEMQRLMKLGMTKSEAALRIADDKMINETQFVYGKAGSPMATSNFGAWGKPLFMFWSFPVHQAELFTQWAKENPLKLVHYLGLSTYLENKLEEDLHLDMSNALGLGVNATRLIDGFKDWMRLRDEAGKIKMSLALNSLYAGNGVLPSGIGGPVGSVVENYFKTGDWDIARSISPMGQRLAKLVTSISEGIRRAPTMENTGGTMGRMVTPEIKQTEGYVDRSAPRVPGGLGDMITMVSAMGLFNGTFLGRNVESNTVKRQVMEYNALSSEQKELNKDLGEYLGTQYAYLYRGDIQKAQALMPEITKRVNQLAQLGTPMSALAMRESIVFNTIKKTASKPVAYLLEGQFKKWFEAMQLEGQTSTQKKGVYEATNQNIPKEMTAEDFARNAFTLMQDLISKSWKRAK